MKKILYMFLLLSLSICTFACTKPEILVEVENVFDYLSDNDLVIYTENVEKIDSILFDNKELDKSNYEFIGGKFYIENSFLKNLGYGDYDLIVNIDNNEYPIKVYIRDSRTPYLELKDLYKYNDASIVIPVELYNSTLELYYNDKLMEDYVVEDGNLIILAKFIEFCDVEDIVITYKFSYYSCYKPTELSFKEGTINIEKILFGDIEW